MLGKRILTARLAGGLTQKSLSEGTGIAASKISKIETGMADPTDNELLAISSALSVPVSYFCDRPIYPTVDGRFRRQSKASAAQVKSLTATTSMLAEVVQEASEEYRLRPVTIRPVEGEVTASTIEEQAQLARTSLGLPSNGPVGNVIRSCERGGVAVARIPISDTSRKLSGYSTWGNMGELRPIIVVSASLPGDVLRTTVAHELGHLILHTLRPLVGPDSGEDEAWVFSNHFLFPKGDAEEIFRDTPVTLRTLQRVKQNYGVSVSFLISCCLSFGIIDEVKGRSLRKQYSARHWYANEPGEVVEETTSMVPAILSRMKKDGKDIGLQEFLAWKLSSAA